MRFDKPKGQRMYKQFVWITTRGTGLWWVPFYKKWLPIEERNGHSASTACPCKSVKAFRRHLRKHPEIKGHAILCSNFVGYNVHG